MNDRTDKAGIDDISDIQALYDREPDREHDRLVRHQLEYDLTWRYLDEYLPSSGRVLEIGAATGRYTLALAKRGYRVTALDLSGVSIAMCRDHLEREGLSDQVDPTVGDARDLGMIPDESFDAVLLMGPLYHLIRREDRILALGEAKAKLKEGGVVFTAFISRLGIFGDLLKNCPDWIENQEELRSLLEHGHAPDFQPRVGFRGYFAEVEEIVPLHEAMGLETLCLAGVEPAIAADDASYNSLEGPRRKQWLDLLFELSARPELIASSRHLLHVGRK